VVNARDNGHRAQATMPAPGLRESLAAMSEGRTSAVALVQQTLALAQACNEAVNAFSVIALKHALAAAVDSDRRYAAGNPRALEGLPIAVKDLIDTAGIETRYGSRAYIGHVPQQDAQVVQALLEQGAIVIGKATTHEFAWGVTTSNSTFGDTLNPLDTTRIPGGSSGGTAAAIAYGAVAAGLGTDTGGSVRIPAALCGVVGFKPTLGAFPTRGIFPLAPTLDHPGLLGRSVDDVLVLAEALGVRRCAAADGARIGVIREVDPVPLEPGVAAAFDAALENIGQQFECGPLRSAGLFDGTFQAFAGIVLAEGGMAHFARSDWDWIAANYGSETVERLIMARGVVLEDYRNWQQTRRRFIGKLSETMTGVDYLLLPTCPCVAPVVNQAAVSIGGWTGNVRQALMTYTSPFNLAGFPTITIPLPQTDAALPAGLQIVARPGSDGELLQFALQLEGILKP
jgi:aspartyl-tRNA(Asn)/glutamyl-tRNA(Gln) amidotransferase subunit A